uniref:Uncharacterized protein n=1 Tax=Chromera velia CCMP2878 TaxID=1169474 RepID=A0A0G4I1Y9_9ALVE|eukprot:Cvel_10266.t1-p1 / transcript=Cvel_10266.t1 / gene=Cvel_10266 / organism=Chromera_velia_CCMP2878 / gene_product=hypothetical protein / transcript_product=hypothetical protein / location=Cvel_scaffold615:48881-73340(-) / protein_length=2378 / sequence_SO=supercontig / SO=protein_coding / is_pseudo=false
MMHHSLLSSPVPGGGEKVSRASALNGSVSHPPGMQSVIQRLLTEGNEVDDKTKYGKFVYSPTIYMQTPKKESVKPSTTYRMRAPSTEEDTPAPPGCLPSLSLHLRAEAQPSKLKGDLQRLTFSDDDKSDSSFPSPAASDIDQVLFPAKTAKDDEGTEQGAKEARRRRRWKARERRRRKAKEREAKAKKSPPPLGEEDDGTLPPVPPLGKSTQMFSGINRKSFVLSKSQKIAREIQGPPPAAARDLPEVEAQLGDIGSMLIAKKGAVADIFMDLANWNPEASVTWRAFMAYMVQEITYLPAVDSVVTLHRFGTCIKFWKPNAARVPELYRSVQPVVWKDVNAEETEIFILSFAVDSPTNARYMVALLSTPGAVVFERFTSSDKKYKKKGGDWRQVQEVRFAELQVKVWFCTAEKKFMTANSAGLISFWTLPIVDSFGWPITADIFIPPPPPTKEPRQASNTTGIPDGTLDKVVGVLGVEKPKETGLPQCEAQITSCVDIGSHLFATGSLDKTVAVWDSGSLNRIATYKAHEFAVLAMTYLPKFSMLVVVGCSKSLGGPPLRASTLLLIPSHKRLLAVDFRISVFEAPDDITRYIGTGDEPPPQQVGEGTVDREGYLPGPDGNQELRALMPAEDPESSIDRKTWMWSAIDGRTGLLCAVCSFASFSFRRGQHSRIGRTTFRLTEEWAQDYVTCSCIFEERSMIILGHRSGRVQFLKLRSGAMLGMIPPRGEEGTVIRLQKQQKESSSIPEDLFFSRPHTPFSVDSETRADRDGTPEEGEKGRGGKGGAGALKKRQNKGSGCVFFPFDLPAHIAFAKVVPGRTPQIALGTSRGRLLILRQLKVQRGSTDLFGDGENPFDDEDNEDDQGDAGAGESPDSLECTYDFRHPRKEALSAIACSDERRQTAVGAQDGSILVKWLSFSEQHRLVVWYACGSVIVWDLGAPILTERINAKQLYFLPRLSNPFFHFGGGLEHCAWESNNDLCELDDLEARLDYTHQRNPLLQRRQHPYFAWKTQQQQEAQGEGPSVGATAVGKAGEAATILEPPKMPGEAVEAGGVSPATAGGGDGHATAERHLRELVEKRSVMARAKFAGHYQNVQLEPTCMLMFSKSKFVPVPRGSVPDNLLAKLGESPSLPPPLPNVASAVSPLLPPPSGGSPGLPAASSPPAIPAPNRRQSMVARRMSVLGGARGPTTQFPLEPVVPYTHDVDDPATLNIHATDAETAARVTKELEGLQGDPEDLDWMPAFQEDVNVQLIDDRTSDEQKLKKDLELRTRFFFSKLTPVPTTQRFVPAFLWEQYKATQPLDCDFHRLKARARVKTHTSIVDLFDSAKQLLTMRKRRAEREEREKQEREREALNNQRKAPNFFNDANSTFAPKKSLIRSHTKNVGGSTLTLPKKTAGGAQAGEPRTSVVSIMSQMSPVKNLLNAELADMQSERLDILKGKSGQDPEIDEEEEAATIDASKGLGAQWEQVDSMAEESAVDGWDCVDVTAASLVFVADRWGWVHCVDLSASIDKWRLQQKARDTWEKTSQALTNTAVRLRRQSGAGQQSLPLPPVGVSEGPPGSVRGGMQVGVSQPSAVMAVYSPMASSNPVSPTAAALAALQTLQQETQGGGGRPAESAHLPPASPTAPFSEKSGKRFLKKAQSERSVVLAASVSKPRLRGMPDFGPGREDRDKESTAKGKALAGEKEEKSKDGDNQVGETSGQRAAMVKRQKSSRFWRSPTKAEFEDKMGKREDSRSTTAFFNDWEDAPDEDLEPMILFSFRAHSTAIVSLTETQHPPGLVTCDTKGHVKVWSCGGVLWSHLAPNKYSPGATANEVLHPLTFSHRAIVWPPPQVLVRQLTLSRKAGELKAKMYAHLLKGREGFQKIYQKFNCTTTRFQATRSFAASEASVGVRIADPSADGGGGGVPPHMQTQTGTGMDDETPAGASSSAGVQLVVNDSEGATTLNDNENQSPALPPLPARQSGDLPLPATATSGKRIRIDLGEDGIVESERGGRAERDNAKGGEGTMTPSGGPGSSVQSPSGPGAFLSFESGDVPSMETLKIPSPNANEGALKGLSAYAQSYARAQFPIDDEEWESERRLLVAAMKTDGNFALTEDEDSDDAEEKKKKKVGVTLEDKKELDRLIADHAFSKQSLKGSEMRKVTSKWLASDVKSEVPYHPLMRGSAKFNERLGLPVRNDRHPAHKRGTFEVLDLPKNPAVVPTRGSSAVPSVGGPQVDDGAVSLTEDRDSVAAAAEATRRLLKAQSEPRLLGQARALAEWLTMETRKKYGLGANTRAGAEGAQGAGGGKRVSLEGALSAKRFDQEINKRLLGLQVARSGDAAAKLARSMSQRSGVSRAGKKPQNATGRQQKIETIQLSPSFRNTIKIATPTTTLPPV